MKFNELLEGLKSRDLRVPDQYEIYFTEKVQVRLVGILAAPLEKDELEMIRPKREALLSLALMPGMKAEDFAQIENEQISAAFEDLSRSRALDAEEDYCQLAADYYQLRKEFMGLQEIDVAREKLVQARASKLLRLRREFNKLKQALERTAENATQLSKNMGELLEHMPKLSYRAETAEAALRVAQEKLVQFGLSTEAVARGRARSAAGRLGISQNTAASAAGVSAGSISFRGPGLFSDRKGGEASSAPAPVLASVARAGS